MKRTILTILAIVILSGCSSIQTVDSDTILIEQLEVEIGYMIEAFGVNEDGESMISASDVLGLLELAKCGAL